MIERNSVLVYQSSWAKFMNTAFLNVTFIFMPLPFKGGEQESLVPFFAIDKKTLENKSKILDK